VWKHLRHQNIVSLIGITSTPLQVVSEWMPGGDLTEYIKTHPDTDRLGLVGVLPPVPNVMLTPPRKLRDITDGLHYLHSRHVVHGDLKGVRDGSESRFTTVLTLGPAERPRGCHRLCTDHRFWSRQCHSKPRL
jgi:serine/threonine protein kinase